MSEQNLKCQCCVAGGGPAGLMLGYLLARAGVQVIVLEKHADFLRDFRGDTIHPSTLEVMHELGLLDKFLKLPHQRAGAFNTFVGGEEVEVISFATLPVQCRFVALMPQWDFLNFLAEEASAFPNFTLLMSTEATQLIYEGQKVVGVQAQSNGTEITITAPLVVAADGRTSVLRDSAGLEVKNFKAPIDVLWFRVPRHQNDTDQMGANIAPGRIVVQLNRGDYWQCAYIIPKGGFAKIQSDGLDAFRNRVAKTTTFDVDRLQSLTSWDDVKLLTVTVNRLLTWYRDGFLAIGDAAHAMSPAGGVGVNLAIQDAVATANHLHESLRRDQPITLSQLEWIQKRRLWPTRIIQAMQVSVHKNLIQEALSARADDDNFVPMPIRIMQKFPFLQRLPARIVGLGVRMEHVAPELRT